MQFDEFLSVLDLLKDTKKYSERVAELQAHEKAIADATTQLGVVGDIAKAKQQATSLVEKAETTLEAAKKEAAKIVADARVVYDKRHTELHAREVVADQAVADYNTMKASQAARENVLHTKEKEVETLRTSLQKQLTEVASKQLEVDERLAKLRQVMG